MALDVGDEGEGEEAVLGGQVKDKEPAAAARASPPPVQRTGRSLAARRSVGRYVLFVLLLPASCHCASFTSHI